MVNEESKMMMATGQLSSIEQSTVDAGWKNNGQQAANKGLTAIKHKQLGSIELQGPHNWCIQGLGRGCYQQIS